MKLTELTTEQQQAIRNQLTKEEHSWRDYAECRKYSSALDKDTDAIMAEKADQFRKFQSAVLCGEEIDTAFVEWVRQNIDVTISDEDALSLFSDQLNQPQYAFLVVYTNAKSETALQTQ